MFEDKVKELFKDLKLGKPIKIRKTDLKWAKGEIWHVQTIFKQFIVTEQNGYVRTIKNKKKIFYSRQHSN